MIAVRWPDGRTDTAPDARALLRIVNAHPWNAHLAPDEFREQMAWRAMQWAGLKIDPDAPAEEFVAQLAEAHLLEITE